MINFQSKGKTRAVSGSENACVSSPTKYINSKRYKILQVIILNIQ